MNDPDVFSEPCAICKVRKAVRWCDFVIFYNRTPIFVKGYENFSEINSSPHDETCDLPLCEKCTHEQNLADLCPYHYKLQLQAELPKHLRRAQARSKMKIAQELLNS